MFVLPPLSLHAQDYYTSHWTEVSKALRNDLPATALEHIGMIRQHALKEGNMPQLCRALFEGMQCQTAITPDSLDSCIEAIRDAMQQESSPARRAVYTYLLGRCQHDSNLLRLAMADLPLLADSRAEDYLPLIEKHDGSERIYGGDLLHLFVRDFPDENAQNYLQQAISLYTQRGMMAAAYSLMLQLDKEEAELYPILRGAVDERPDLQQVPDIMAYLAQVEQPRISLECLHKGVVTPGSTIEFVARARNVDTASFSFGQENYTFTFAKAQPWEEVQDTLRITPASAGIYEATLRMGSLRDKAKVHVSSVKPMIFGLPDERCRIVLVDARTGAPLASPRLVKRDNHGRVLHTYLPAKDGFIYLSRTDWRSTNGEQASFYAEAGKDTFHPALKSWNLSTGYFSEEGDIRSTPVQIYTDRNIYRPSQEVHVGILAYSRHNDDYQVCEGDSLTLRCTDQNDRTLYETELTTDEFGSASATFRLPHICLPGHIWLHVAGRRADQSGSHTIRVEEYKRPTIELKMDAFTETFSPGDTVQISGLLQTYSGIPLADTRITTSAGDTLTTDASGRFAFNTVVERQPRWYWMGPSVTVTATASNGETAETTVHVPLRWREPKPEPASKYDLPFWEECHTNEQGTEATLTIGTSVLQGTSPVTRYAFLDIACGSRIVEQRMLTFTDSLSYTLKYRPEWGDGATLTLAFVRDGELHSASASVTRPTPDKRLMLRWGTFRSYLQPGQDEEWTLEVTRPDGSAANALVMARLYDATLDAFASNQWHLDLPFGRSLPSTHWSSPRWNCDYLSLERPLPQITPLRFDAWRDELFYYAGRRFRGHMLYANAMAPMAAGIKMKTQGTNSLEEAALDMDAAVSTAESASAQEDTKTTVKTRKNFDETAFFLPTLRTDETGTVKMAFRLPESLTTWHFTALAHDRDMNYGLLNDTIIARRQLMAEIAAPRFMRDGDETSIPVTVTNLSTDTQECTLSLWCDDSCEQRPVTLAAGERRTLTFPYTAHAPEGGYVVLKASLTSRDYCDGEERIVPLLTNMVEVTRSVPYSLTKRGSRNIDLSPLWHELQNSEGAARHIRFSREECTNPAWYVANALTPMLDEKAESALSWATRLYALQMAQHIRPLLPADMASHATGLSEEEAMAQNPLTRNEDLRQTLLEESPWLVAARSETERWQRMGEIFDENALSAQITSAYSQLRDLQSACGGWSWYKGMPESVWVSLNISTLLARMEVLTQVESGSREMLHKSLPYLQQEMHRIVREMKERERRDKIVLPLNELHYNYLYLCTLMEQKANGDISYLLNKMKDDNHSLSIYGKAGCAVILAHYGYHKQAQTLIKSLLEHSVSTDEMGRYFDTRRAHSGWESYKIPTQTFAIEALQHLDAQRYERQLAELRLWLLQSKRTQMWMTSRATADAIYAVMTGGEDYLTPDAQGAGYSRQSYAENELIGQPSLTVTNPNDRPLWGAAYVQYLLPMQNVLSSQSGLSIERSVAVKRGDKWESLPNDPALQQLHVGDRLRIEYSIRAECDMDYVSLKACRAACMEPVQALSGYDYRGYYRSVRDQRNDYFFEHLSKGRHTLSEEGMVDRTGTFTLGTATAECVYAPEYRGDTDNMALCVTEM